MSVSRWPWRLVPAVEINEMPGRQVYPDFAVKVDAEVPAQVRLA